MKILIRTITIATLGLFMILIVLHGTVVESIKHEMDVATVTALNRTIDAYEANRVLMAQGEDTNLYFKTDSDYYYYFYDSLLVQLNGFISVDIYCNDVDIDTGLLDVDVTVLYRGLDKKMRSYTKHCDTIGKISDFDFLTESKKNMLKEMEILTTGDKLRWAGHNWVVVDNSIENLAIMLDESYMTSIWTLKDNQKGMTYDYSTIKIYSENFVNGNIADEEDRNMIAESSLDELNTFGGYYTMGMSDEAVTAKAYPVSRSEAEMLLMGYNPTIEEANRVVKPYVTDEKYWTRTASGADQMYIVDGDSLSTADIEEEIAIRPVLRLIKVKANSFSWEEVEGQLIYSID